MSVQPSALCASEMWVKSPETGIPFPRVETLCGISSYDQARPHKRASTEDQPGCIPISNFDWTASLQVAREGRGYLTRKDYSEEGKTRIECGTAHPIDSHMRVRLLISVALADASR